MRYPAADQNPTPRSTPPPRGLLPRPGRLLPPLLALVLLVAPGLALGGDGRIEINQARALAGGVSPGDTPGFPVTLVPGRNYVFTSDLEVPLDTDGIEVDFASPGRGVVVDLNGFSLRGPATCSGLPPTCSGTGAGLANGIALSFGPAEIRNGTILGFARHGIYAFISASHLRLTDLEIRENGGDGIAAISTESALLRGLTVRNNGGRGIDIGDSTQLLDSLVVNNGSIAVSVDGASFVHRNTIDASSAGSVAFRASGGVASETPGYSNNVIWGTIQGGIDLGQNLCNGATSC